MLGRARIPGRGELARRPLTVATGIGRHLIGRTIRVLPAAHLPRPADRVIAAPDDQPDRAEGDT